MKALRGFLLVLAFAGLASGAWATDGTTLLYGGGGEGRVTFDGQLHAAKGYVCNDCHLTLFSTQKKALISFDDHKTATLCFACHDGHVAFGQCHGCHRDIQPVTTAVAPATGPDRPATPGEPAAIR
jgi:c(7)-type cytochrome triheme protein